MMHKIEVDEVVWSLLKKQAEPFEDTPNSVLRRLLLAKSQRTISARFLSSDNGETPIFPKGVPTALQQILEVAYLVVKLGYTRTEATNTVAKRREVAPQTVIDKYCRQLNKKAFEIDRLLDYGLEEFRAILKKYFLHHHDVIDDFFERL